MTGQDVAVFREDVPARVNDDVLDAVGRCDVHLGDVGEPEVDVDHVGVEPVASCRTVGVPRRET